MNILYYKKYILCGVNKHSPVGSYITPSNPLDINIISGLNIFNCGIIILLNASI